jgi:hypothetical protein
MTVKHMFQTDAISRAHKFRFEAIVNLKQQTGSDPSLGETYLAEFLSAVKFVEVNGLYVGKRTSKEMGKIKLENASFQVISRQSIDKRASEIAALARSQGKITVLLLSDALAPFPLKGEDLARDAKNASKFFDPEYTPYEDPTMTLVDASVELKTSVSFMDYKQYTNKPRFDKPDHVISRGTSFTYKIPNASNEFYRALATAELLRGIGDRTSFGKGEFVIK